MRKIILVLSLLVCAPSGASSQWQRLNVPTPHIVTIDALDNFLFVLGRDDSNYTLHTSNDHGFNWTTDTVYPTSFDADLSLNGAIVLYKLNAVAPDQIYVSGYLLDEWWDCFSAEIGVYLRSSDSGWKWLGPAGSLSRGAEIVTHSKDTVALLSYGAFLCGDWGSSTALYLSFDSGRSFTRNISHLFSLIYSMKSNREVANVLFWPDQSGVAITLDAGESWDTVLADHHVAIIESSSRYWRAEGTGDSVWYSSDGVDWIYDPGFELPPDTKMHHKWTGDSLLVSIDSGRSFAVHSRLPGKITSVDTSGEVYYAQIGDSAVYRFPLDARSVRSTPARTRVSISPNPSQGLVRLKALFPESIKRVYVTTMIGTEIAIDGIREITPTNEFELDLRNLPNGSYLLHVVTESNEYIEKLIKQ